MLPKPEVLIGGLVSGVVRAKACDTGIKSMWY